MKKEKEAKQRESVIEQGGREGGERLSETLIQTTSGRRRRRRQRK
jgi:hypothetical protein